MSDSRVRLLMAVVAAIAGFAAAFLFLGFPGIDPFVSSLFYRDGGFTLQGPGPAEGVRQLFVWALRILAVAALAGLWIGAAKRRPLFGLGFREWAFLILLLVVGPGLVANTMLKNEWGRPRPRQTIEFGGDKPFTPPLLRTDLCDRNCSFIGGEASSVFAVGFGFALVVPAWRRMFAAAGILGGLLVGLIRIGQGGHFTSDIVFAGIFMALAAAFCHWIVFGLLGGALSDDAPARSALQRCCGRITEAPGRLFARLRRERASTGDGT